MREWHSACDALSAILKHATFTDNMHVPMSADIGFHRWCDMGIALREAGACCYFIGNGASASMASHFSADINKNANIRTQVFTDLALLTALGNDLSFTDIYAEPLRRHCVAGDMLLAISSSGNSPNIVAAIHMARTKGAKIITLSGMKSDNTIRQLGDINVHVPALTYGQAESAHAVILHHWTDLLLAQQLCSG